MTASFGAAADRLAGVAARLLGWRPHEFWCATPAELASAIGGWREGDDAGGLSADDLRTLMERLPDGR